MPARFGDFEVDLQAGQLRKRGIRIKLQEQPFQVLAALLQRPGEVVTREELQQRIWPDGTFVDFDQSLNKAVNKLRVALADSADRPRYIETIPRRGYRFVGAVERPDPPSTPAASDASGSLEHGPAVAAAQPGSRIFGGVDSWLRPWASCWLERSLPGWRFAPAAAPN